MQVQTDHQIVGFGDRMTLVDTGTLDVIVLAERTDGVWTVKADGHADVKVPATQSVQPPRENVIQAMIDLALEVSPNDGYSTLVPHGLPDLP
jgi:hypothetical protein